MRTDRGLLDALEIIEQLGGTRDSDVAKDLQYILDTT